MWAQDFDRTGINNIVRSDQNIENPHFKKTITFLRDKIQHFRDILGPLLGPARSQKTPEMNVSE